jgi:hypothetical protein
MIRIGFVAAWLVAVLVQVSAAQVSQEEAYRRLQARHKETGGQKTADNATKVLQLEQELHATRTALERAMQELQAVRTENDQLRSRLQAKDIPPTAPNAAIAPPPARPLQGPTRPEAIGGFRAAKWGMSREQVMKTEAREAHSNSGNVLMYEDKIAGLDVTVGYVFAGDVLVRGVYLATEEHSNKNLFLDDFAILVEAITQKYGKPAEEKTYWSNRLFVDDPEQYGMAISVGHLTKYTEWDLPDSKILVGIRGDNHDITLKAEYSSKQHAGMEQRMKDAQDKAKL